VDKWRQEAESHPRNGPTAKAATAAVRLCADELEAAIEEDEVVDDDVEEDDDQDVYECHCGDSFDTERGLKIHQGRVHADDNEEESEAEEEPDDESPRLDLDSYDWPVTELDVVESLAGAESVEEFARTIGLDGNEAADMLRDLQLLEQLRDRGEPLEYDQASAVVTEAVT
jgi:hypothetical protein